MNLPENRAGFVEGSEQWIKTHPQDFLVEELPAYPLTGEGTHLWLRVQKQGLTTRAVIARLATALDKPARQFGYAGQKDARAITVQWLSIEHVPKDFEARLAPFLGAATTGTWKILDWTFHRTRLGLGHSHGNRFRIVLRGLNADELSLVPGRLEQLARVGAPNAFGSQRFGLRGNNADVGAALLRGDAEAALAEILGRTSERDTGRFREAREAFDRGDLSAARQAWPRDCRLEARLLQALERGGDAAAALAAAEKRDLLFYLHAWQSAGFNRVLAARWDAARGVTLETGDLAMRLPGGRTSFEVTDLATEQARAAQLEIAATGPLFAARMPSPTGAAAALEARVLAEAGLTLEQLAGFPQLTGGRRALVMQLIDARCHVLLPGAQHNDTEHSDTQHSDTHLDALAQGLPAVAADASESRVVLEFAMAKGCFATSVVDALRFGDAD